MCKVLKERDFDKILTKTFNSVGTTNKPLLVQLTHPPLLNSAQNMLADYRTSASDCNV